MNVLLPNCIEFLHGFLIPESTEESIHLMESESEIELGWNISSHCVHYGSKIKVATFFEDDDVDYFSRTKAFLLSARVHCFVQLNSLVYIQTRHKRDGKEYGVK